MHRLGLLAGVLVSLIALLGVAAVASASSATSAGALPGSPAAASALAPVYIHFSPKSTSSAPGGTVHITAVVNDKGSHSYVATSCILWYRIGTSGSWTKAGSCLKPSDFPHTFSAHSKTKFAFSQHVSKTFPAGTYEWKIVAVGTYNGVTEDSHAGYLTVTIT